MRTTRISTAGSRGLLLLLLFLSWAALAWAQDLRPVPQLSSRVIDQTGTLPDAERAVIDERLAALEAAKGSQMVVLMVSSTAPEDIASYANRVANAWKIGRRDIGDGIVLVIAKDDRRVRIEVAKALEGAVPDLAAKRIIDEAITPRFRQGDFGGGILTGVERLAGLVRGEPLPEPTRQQGAFAAGDGKPDYLDLLVFMVFALPIGAAIVRSIFGRKLGSLLTGAAVGAMAFIVTSSIVLAVLAGIAGLVFALVSAASGPIRAIGRGGRGAFPSTGGWGGGGGFGSGGGFSSGGGGDFGGGGASGKW